MSEILCYDLVNGDLQPFFDFPDLREFDPQTYAKQLKITCLSHRRDLGDYEPSLQSDLSKRIVSMKYRTREEIRNEIKGKQQEVEKLKFRNYINPLSKIKEGIVERVVPIVYVGAPAIGIPASLMADNEVGLVLSIFVPVVAEINRRAGMCKRNADIKKVKETFKRPKVRIFSDLLEGKSEISLDKIFVEPASKYIEKISDPDVLASTNYIKVNEKLTEIYQNYAAQAKA